MAFIACRICTEQLYVLPQADSVMASRLARTTHLSVGDEPAAFTASFPRTIFSQTAKSVALTVRAVAKNHRSHIAALMLSDANKEA